ncbi:hypothetical protein CW714_07345 [Methanophagales archaeon]|nr:MAG: hypothetical protein CW714_07345 [Methanophagales archaeon]
MFLLCIYYNVLLFGTQIYTDLRNTFSLSKNTFFLKKEPVLRKYSSFGKAFLSKKRFVLKVKQISLVKLSFHEAFLINLFLKGLKKGLC